MRKAIKLSATERAILNSYSTLLDGFSDYFGSGYEFVLHSLDNFDRSVVKIVNGHHTGRQIGAPVTDLALAMLAKLEAQGGANHITYGAKTKRGDPLHSSTIAITGDAGRTIGLLCINFHLNTPLNQIVQDLFKTTLEAGNRNHEHHAVSVDESLAEAIEAAKRAIDLNDSLPVAMKNKSIIAALHEQGLFQLKGAVPAVAVRLGLSKNTVYLHIRALES